MGAAILAVLRIAFTLACWGAAFLLARLAAWHWQKPAWWTLPLGLGAGCLWHAWALRRERSGREERADADDARAAPPHLASAMRDAWDAGESLRRRARPGFLGRRPAAPWLVHLSRECDPEDHPLAGEGAAAGVDEDFSWRLGERGLWIDLPFMWEPEADGLWRAFLGVFSARPADVPIGAVVSLDAAKLLSTPVERLCDGAAPLRQRLEQLRLTLGGRMPVYLLVNRVDRLYGMRSLAAALDPERLDKPLGAVRDDSDGSAARFVRALLRRSAAELFPGTAGDGRLAAAAAQAPAELLRLEKPLAAFCVAAFDNGGDENAPELRGVFLVSTGTRGAVLPPLLSELATFRPAREADEPPGPWFLRPLLRTGLAADLPVARRSGPGAARNGVGVATVGVLAATLALCWLLTFSFLESKNLLLSAAGRTAPPETVEELAPYFELAASASRHTRQWPLPRLGMVEGEMLADELRRRYLESYHDLKTVPDMEAVQDAAIMAGRSRDPRVIGDALLVLAYARDGISRNLAAPEGPPDAASGVFLRRLVVASGLADSEEVARLDGYLDWAGSQEWMPVARDALAEFEKHVVDRAAGGRLEWLPAWIAGLPGLEPVDPASVWEPSPRLDDDAARVSPAWTLPGYRIAQGMLEAVVYGKDRDPAWEARREAYLAAYRRRALLEWRGAAAGLWKDFPRRVGDAEVAEMLRLAGRGEDPASRFAALAREHLLPMFRDEAEPPPEVAWLRLSGELDDAPAREAASATGARVREAARAVAATVRSLARDDGLSSLLSGGPEPTVDRAFQGAVDQWNLFHSAMRRTAALIDSPLANLEAVRRGFRGRHAPSAELPPLEGDPHRQAGEAAARVDRFLAERAGATWETLSPRAVFEYARRLAVREAALCLDALWRDTTYAPCLLTPGDNAEKMRRLLGSGGLLEKFLTGPAAGFWRWDGGRAVNASWNGVDFMLAGGFLDLCSESAARPFEPLPRRIEFTLRLESVGVDPDARERPTAVEVGFASPAGDDVLTYRNFSDARTLVWDRDASTGVVLRAHFPSTVAELEFPGETGLEQFAAIFEPGGFSLDVDSFAEGDRLRRLGVTRLTVRGELAGRGEAARVLHGVEPTPPASIIASDAGAGGALAVR